MPHPLTDELLQQIGCSNPRARVFDAQAMRAAADWQLEQVMEWLKEHLEALAPGVDTESVITDLKQAMRPTTQENNS